MTQFTHLLGTLQRSDSGRIEAHIPEGWMQGRTTYGGLTAALSLESARAIADDIPLRSAQVAFVGPVGGDVVVTPTLLRRGKNTAFVSVTVVGEKGCAAQSIFAFGIKRDSALDFSSVAPPEVGEPNEVESFFGGGPRPAFANHFNIRLAAGARPISGADEADLSLWLRHKDEAAIYNATTLLALADAPPPAAMALFKQPAPLSSMTWMAEFLTDEIDTDNGWFLVRHTAQSARDGYSSQAMRMWNSRREPIMVGRQTVAVFV